MSLEPCTSDECADLMLRTIEARSGIARTNKSFAFARTYVEDRMCRADRIVVRRVGDRLLSAALLTAPHDRGVANPERELMLLSDPIDLSLSWFAETLDGWEPLFGAETFIQLESPHHAAGVSLRRRGFGVAKHFVGGFVRDVRAALETHNLIDVADLGLRLSVLQWRHVDAVVAMRRAFFERHRAVVFGPSPMRDAVWSHMDRAASASFAAQIEAGRDCTWVVERGDRIVGWFGLSPHFDHPLYGVIAGVDIMFDERARGLGLGRRAYQVMMARAVELGVERIRGTTFNPAVVHLASTMGRPTTGRFFRRRGPFLNLGDPAGRADEV